MLTFNEFFQQRIIQIQNLNSSPISKERIALFKDEAAAVFDVMEDEPKVEISDQFINGIAARMYTAYCEAVGGVAFNGDPLPEWPEFLADPSKAKQSGGWIAAAKAITQ